MLGAGRSSVGYSAGVIFPIGSNLVRRSTPLVTYAAAAMHVAAYVLVASRVGRDQEMFEKALEAWGYTGLAHPLGLLTHVWVQFGLLAMAMNLLFLVVIGGVVEDRLGHVGVLLVYLAGAAATAMLDRAVFPGEPTPVIGPAGGLAALTGVFAALAPGGRIRFAIVFLLMTTFELSGGWIIGLSLVKEIVTGGSIRGVESTALVVGSGFVFGLAVGLLAMLTGLVSRQEFDLIHVWKQRRRLAELRQVADEIASRQTELTRKRAGAAAQAEISDACREARTAVSDRLAARDWAGVAEAFSAFILSAGEHDDRPKLARRVHLDAANGLFAAGRPGDAAGLYERFLRDHASDRETPHVRLILAVIRLRRQAAPDPAAAAKLLDGLESVLTDADDLAVLGELRRELAGDASKEGRAT